MNKVYDNARVFGDAKVYGNRLLLCEGAGEVMTPQEVDHRSVGRVRIPCPKCKKPTIAGDGSWCEPCYTGRRRG